MKKLSFYARYPKRLLDMILSLLGMIVLSPLFLLVSAAIWLDDPGPVLFTQKRFGQNKQFFQLHKFRSMKLSAPHDIPTHLLDNPDQYITRVGRFIRKFSLDELPQIWDILRGKMSIIGPRPALWNQEDLIAERDRYGANVLRPGLTGWAQINGRDELPIAVKARLDGEYAAHISFLMDLKCFFGTFTAVVLHKGFVEGGSTEQKQQEPDQK